MEGQQTRFRYVSKKDIEEIEQGKDSSATKRNEICWMNLFDTWGAERAAGPVKLLELSKEQLAAILPEFFMGIRTKQNRHYRPQSYVTITASVVRKWGRERGEYINFFRDPLFKSAFVALDGYVATLQKAGYVGKPNQAIAFTKQMKKVCLDSAFFSEKTSDGLLHRAYLSLADTLSRVGWHHSLLASDVTVQEVDGIGECVMIKGRPDKNHPPGISSLRNEDSWNKVVYQNNRNPKYCPVRTIKAYLSHLPRDLPPNSKLYLHPLSKPQGEVWYSHRPVGKDKIGIHLATTVSPS